MTTIRVIAAVLDTQQLTLYKEDGETLAIQQGDPRIRKILDTITPIITAGGVAEVDMTMIATTPYAEFEQKTNGLVKLFRVARKVVQHLMGSDEDRIESTTIGKVPTVDPSTVAPPASVETKQTKAIDEIMANAVSASSPEFHKTPTTEEHTMVAMVGKGADAKIVPGVEALKGQFKHSAKMGSTKGMEALISRLGAIIATGKRGHSVQDVLRFLERGDLPIADDGSIIAYKILRKTPRVTELKTEEGTFYDCHTGKIPQRVGDFVCVAENLVDRNRRNECSNGLHIARRGYLGSFSGDVCVLIKMAPEDVVTVPHGDANKVRVCGYHIIGVIHPTDFAKLRSNQPMTDSSEAKALLAQAIAGRHVGKLRQVIVTQQAGGGVQITNLDHLGQAPPAPKITQEAKTLAVALDDKTVVGSKETVDPKAVAKQVTEQKAAAPKPAPVAKEPFGRKADARTAAAKKVDAILGAPVQAADLSKPLPSPAKGTSGPRQLKALELLNRTRNLDLKPSERQQAAIDLVAFKKTSKVSWEALTIVGQSIDHVVNLANGPKAVDPAPKPTPKAQPPKAKPAAKTVTIATADMNPAKGGRPSISHTIKKTPTTNQGIKKMEGNRVEVARKLFDLALADRKQWPALWVHKRTAKQSWEALGFSKDEIRRINNSKPDHV